MYHWKFAVKLYKYLWLLIALCAMDVNVQGMTPVISSENAGQADLLEELPSSYPELAVLKRDRRWATNRQQYYNEYKQELELRLNNFSDPKELNAEYKSYSEILMDGIAVNCEKLQPFADFLMDENFPDLFARLLDHMPIEKYPDEYKGWLTKALYNQLVPIVKVLIDHNINPNCFTNDHKTPLMHIAQKTIDHSSLIIFKLLLAHGANPQNAGHGCFEPLDALITECMPLKKRALQLLIISGGDDGINFVTQPHKENVITLNQSIQHRNGLFEAVQRGENIPFTNVGDYSRFHMKDIHGNNLLYHALSGKNKAVADKLLKLWPNMLTQPNFEDQSIMDNDSMVRNLFEMYWNQFYASLPNQITELRAANKEKPDGII